MLNFRRKRTEKERIEENPRSDVHNLRLRHHKRAFEENPSRPNEGDLVCEEEIMRDKERFGRVRKSLMNYLRTKYGKGVANRALWRINRRHSEGYFKIKCG